MFLLQNQPVTKVEMAGLKVSALDASVSERIFDLTLGVTEQGGAIRGALEYRTDLYTQPAMQRMVEHWTNLLTGIVSAPHNPLSELPMLTEEERWQLVEEWNGTEAGYPSRCVHELFEEQAQRTPEAVAVEYEGQQLSYAELNSRANQLGHYLRKQGVGPEVRVGICLERSLEMVVGLLGILKAGGAYVPLDASYPRERLAYTLKDSGTELVIGHRGLLREEMGEGIRYLDMEETQGLMAKESQQEVSSGGSGHNLAYLLYTSGSTGVPKGVAVEHRSIVRLVKQSNYFNVGGEEVFLQLAPVAFDASTFEIWGCLLNGGRLVVARPEIPSLEELGAVVEGRGTTVLWLTAGLFHQMVEGRVEKLRKVRQLLAGGDVLNPAHVKRALAALPETRIINGYGPTENTTFTCCYGMDQQQAGNLGERVPIGSPITNTQVYVLDGGQQPVPVGVVGELYIGGAGLARGYLNRPELTGERFLPNPFSRTGGERLYRTGDQVRWLGDGNLEFLGRLDQQVKIRGYRIELGEIEAALQQCVGVRQAVVAVGGDEGGEKRLVAYVVRDEEAGEVGRREWREELKGRLPEYMVPGVYVELGEMPVTANGKVDRKRLPEVEGVERVEGVGADQGPRTAEEEMVKGIWEQVLKVEGMGVEENFFELGGHSLLATQVMSRVREVFGVEMPLRALFESPTVAGLAKQLGPRKQWQQGGKGEEQDYVSKLVRRQSREALPLSYAQQRLWFLNQLEPGSAAYNLPFGVRLSGVLDREGLRRSLQELVRRHEVLRTRFAMAEGQPIQVVESDRELEVEEIDLGGVEEEKREEEAQKIAEAEAKRGFDLEQGPVLRVKLIQVEEGEHVLLVNMHHIVSDGWSAGVMVREFSLLYRAYVEGGEPGLPELKIQYGDYAVWQREWLCGEVLEEELGYWRMQLEGLEPLELPADYTLGRVRSWRGEVVGFQMEKELTWKLKEMSRGAGVTLFMSLLAGLQVVLWKYGGQEEVGVGTPVANRKPVAVENLIGLFVNTLVMRTGLRGDPDFTEVLKRVRRVALEGYQHQDVPFEKVVEELQPERDLTSTPLFQVMLVLQNAEREELELPGLRLKEFAIETGVAKFDLLWTMQESGEGIVGQVNYGCELYKAETVKRLVRDLRWVLERMVADKGQRIGELSLLQGAEREQVMVEWNRTEVEYPQVCVHQLFEEQAVRNTVGDIAEKLMAGIAASPASLAARRRRSPATS
jgi:amino acid adenylation domain-containing protein